MADNTTLNAGAGGDTIITEQIGGPSGPKMCVSKIRLGATDVDGGNVSPTNPFPTVPILLRGGADTPDAARCQTVNNITSSKTAQAFGVQLVDRPAVISAWDNAGAAAATKATVTVPALVGARFVCTSITAAISTQGTAQTPVYVTLIDGGTGGPNLLWISILSCPVNSCAHIELGGISISGSINTPMTLEFSLAGVANSYEVVSLTGYYA